MNYFSVLTTILGALVVASPSANAQDGSNYSTVSVGDLVPSNLSSDAISSSLKPSISVVPNGMKTYVAGLRATIDGTNQCSASLITPTHLLVGSYCVYYDVRWASIGSHYSNGTQDGEQIKIMAILNYPKSSATNFSHDLAIVQLEKPSSFEPVLLASADELDVKDGEGAVKLGWNDTRGSDGEGYQLKRAEVQLMSNEECSKETTVDDSQVCAHGIANNKCWGYGGPLVVERPSGDELIGVASFGPDCRKAGLPFIYSRLSNAREWIESAVGGTCFH